MLTADRDRYVTEEYQAANEREGMNGLVWADGTDQRPCRLAPVMYLTTVPSSCAELRPDERNPRCGKLLAGRRAGKRVSRLCKLIRTLSGR